MAGSGQRDGLFAAVSVVTLIFMVLGITVGIFQWVSYSKEPPRASRAVGSPEPPQLIREGGEGSDAGAVDLDAGAGEKADDDDAAGGDTGGPAGGEEEIEF